MHMILPRLWGFTWAINTCLWGVLPVAAGLVQTVRLPSPSAQHLLLIYGWNLNVQIQPGYRDNTYGKTSSDRRKGGNHYCCL